MQTVGVFDAKNQLSALLDDVENGAEVVITRRGKPVARLTAYEVGFNRAKARRAAEGLRAASQGLRLDGLALRDLIDAGRR